MQCYKQSTRSIFSFRTFCHSSVVESDVLWPDSIYRGKRTNAKKNFSQNRDDDDGQSRSRQQGCKLISLEKSQVDVHTCRRTRLPSLVCFRIKSIPADHEIRSTFSCSNSRFVDTSIEFHIAYKIRSAFKAPFND